MGEVKTVEGSAVTFEGVTPILRVRSVEASLDYYVRVLGFAVDWATPGFVSVSRGRCFLFLCEAEQGHVGGWVWIGVSDAGLLHDELRARGAVIRHPPTNFSWAYEMQVQDPDGNVLRMGSEPKDDMPFGEFLDGRGVAWAPMPDGGWSRPGDA